MKLIVDGNSVLNAALLGGTDEEFGQTFISETGAKIKVNGFQYGVDKFFESIGADLEKFDLAPRDVTLVFDGKNAKARRQAMHPDYKKGRDKDPRVSEQLNLARDLCDKTMLELGGRVVTQVGFEADDVIGYLCRTLPGKKVVSTSDGDLTVLVDENTDVWRLGELSQNPYGPFPFKHITLYKALVGDTSDKIPGAKGFGDVAWCDLVRTFGLDGLDMMADLIVNGKLATLSEDVGSLKCLQKIIDSKDNVTMSWNLAKLHIDEINTMRRPLEIKPGMAVQWKSTDYQVPALRRFYGTKTLVTADNFAAIYQRLAANGFRDSPFVSLDIETSTSEESDEWVESVKALSEKGKAQLDVLGSELTGMSLTFGANTQHTIYMCVDHKDTANITVDQCREMCELIPHESLFTIIQNRSFEFSVLYRTWGEMWKDNGWSGFVPNAIDSMLAGSHVDENLRKGLKERSLHHLGYTQATYEETTTKSGRAAVIDADTGEVLQTATLSGGQITKEFKKEVMPAVYGPDYTTDEVGEEGVVEVVHPGELVTPAVVEVWESRQYKMNELTGPEVFDYGCDDTICTAALQTHYQFVMELENTWNAYLEVEQLPEYLTSLAFVQGIPVNMGKLAEMSARDDKTHADCWAKFRAFLLTKGWEGTVCPEFEGTLEPSDVKLAVGILLGGEFKSAKRKLNGLAADIRTQYPDNDDAILVASIVEAGDVASLNSLVKDNFTGEPQINFDSPKQMQSLLYRTLGMTPRIVNKMTDKQRNGDVVMATAFKKRRQAKKAGRPAEYTPEELDALISKSSTDDDAVNFSLAIDVLSDESREILSALQTIKQIETRRKLYYRPYRGFPHWRDGRLHPSLRQSEAVTRRYSAAAPNVQQQPSRGEGLELRECIVAHHSDAVVVSLDFNGQELRLGAEVSGDAALTSCYVGANKRDVHSLTAVAAAVKVYGKDLTYEQFQLNRKSSDPVVKAEAEGLRGDAKTTNFSAQYGAFAESVAIKMKCSEETAQAFLDAREDAFPGLGIWDKKVKADANECGFALTMMGARRHLRDALLSDNQWDRAAAERQVANFWIQGSAGEMTKLAMARVWLSGICSGKYDAVFYFPVHDELVFSVHKDQAADFIAEAHACMVAQYSTMKIPLESSIAIGRTFACEVEVGMTPDKDLINKVVRELFERLTQKEEATA